MNADSEPTASSHSGANSTAASIRSELLGPSGAGNVRPESPAAGAAGHATSPTLAGVRASLRGATGDVATQAAADRICNLVPGFASTIEAEHAIRDDAITAAVHRGLTHFVVVGPDLPPMTLAHDTIQESLPAGTDFRVLYVTDDPGVRALLDTHHRHDPRLAWYSPEGADITVCISAAIVDKHLDPRKPFCVLLGSTLQHTRPDVPGLVETLWGLLPGRSEISVSQLAPAASGLPGELTLRCVDDELQLSTGSPLNCYTAEDLDGLFERWELTQFAIHISEPARSRRPRPSTVVATPTVLRLTAIHPDWC